MRMVKPFMVFVGMCLLACNLNDPNQKDHPPYFDKIIVHASSLIDIRKPEKAISYLDSVYTNYPDKGVGDNWKRLNFISTAHYNLARLNVDFKHLKFAENYADSALLMVKPFDKENRYSYELCMSYFQKGDILFELKKYHQAYLYYHRGKLLADQKLHNCQQGIFLNRFALLDYRQKRFASAASLFKKANKDYSTCDLDFTNYMILQGTLSNAGMSYANLGLLDSANNCYEEGLKFLNKYEHLFKNEERDILDARGVFYYNLGENYKAKGEKEKAIYFYENSINLNAINGKEQRHAQITKIHLARTNFEIGNWALSKVLLEEVRNGLDTLPNVKAEEEWQFLMYNFLEIVKQKKEANTYLTNFLKLKKERIKAEGDMILADANEEFNKMQKDYELTIIENEKRFSDLIILFTSSIVLLCLVIIFILFKNIKNSRKNNKALNRINKQMVSQNDYMHETLQSLEESNEENNRVMQIITHDLRSPMAAIVGLSGFMIDEHNLSADDLEVISLINTSGKDSLKFINEILEKESAVGILKTEPLCLNELLVYCTTQLQYKAKEKNQTIKLESHPVTVAINREKIWRVINNLINNSIKFSPNNSVIEVTLKTTANTAIISIKDNGIGIPASLKAYIFAQSDESKREGTNGEKSFGLGLAISKQIVEAHKGTLSFESETGKGTTFFIELPLN